MTNTRWKWARDWGCIGATTSAISPLVATWLLPIDLVDYAVVACLLGGLTGMAVGWGLAAALDVLPKRQWVSMTAVIAPIPLGAWGGLVATLAAAATRADLVPLALACGTVAALAQTTWLAPLYVWLARRDTFRFPLVVSGAVVSPFSGALGVVAGLIALDGLQWLVQHGVL